MTSSKTRICLLDTEIFEAVILMKRQASFSQKADLGGGAQPTDTSLPGLWKAERAGSGCRGFLSLSSSSLEDCPLSGMLSSSVHPQIQISITQRSLVQIRAPNLIPETQT